MKKNNKTYSQLRSRKEVRLEFPVKSGTLELFPSLNTIMSENSKTNWMKWKERKELLHYMILGQTKEKFHNEVEIEYHGYRTTFRDWDNYSASFKFVGDALQTAGVIKDDSPQVVKRFTPFQHKVKTKKEEKYTVIIYEYLQ